MRRVCAASSSSILRLPCYVFANANANANFFDLPLPISSNLFHFRSSSSSSSSRIERSSSELNRLVDELFRSVPTKSDTFADNRLILNRSLSLFHLLLKNPPASNSNPFVPFTKLFTVLTRIRCYSHVISLSRSLDSQANMFILSILINCFCHLNHLDFAMSILGRIYKLGFKPDTTTLIKGFCSHGLLSQALHIFHRMARDHCCQPNVITYSAIIDGLCKLGHTHTAFDLFKKMQHVTCKPNTVTYSIIIDALCKDGHLNQALCLFSQMFSRGIPPNVITYTSLIHGASHQWKLVTTLLNDMTDRRISPDIHTCTVLVDGFCKDGKIGEAHQVVNMMIEMGLEPNTMTYNALMDGYCLRGELKEASQVFQMMTGCGCPPDVYSYTVLINGYCKIGRLNEATNLFRKMSSRDLVQVHEMVIDGMVKASKLEMAGEYFRDLPIKGLQPDIWTYTILINGLCRHGMIREAQELFHEIEENGCSHNECSYATMIRGFVRNGETTKAIQLLDLMVNKGFSPDELTVLSVVTGITSSK